MLYNQVMKFLLRIPGSYLICLLTSSTIPKAALPTDLIVNAENTYGNIAPINNPANTSGLVNEISFHFIDQHYVRNHQIMIMILEQHYQ
jgi:hypothetical protein